MCNWYVFIPQLYVKRLSSINGLCFKNAKNTIHKNQRYIINNNYKANCEKLNIRGEKA